MERYRSGHNGADSKSVCVKAHMGSNPILSASGKLPLPISQFTLVDCDIFFNEIYSVILRRQCDADLIHKLPIWAACFCMCGSDIDVVMDKHIAADYIGFAPSALSKNMLTCS